MSKEAMKLALEALEGAEALLLSMGLTHLIVYGDAEKAIAAIREALAEQPAQQEPVECANGCRGFVKYSPPAQRKPLTPEWYARWLRNNYQDHPNIATLCEEMTKAAHGTKENT